MSQGIFKGVAKWAELVLFACTQIANSVNEGRLVPEDIIFGLLTKRLEDGYNKGETGFILDGIPRTCMQAVSTLYAQTI
jgi:adenylate kinase family enzyme